MFFATMGGRTPAGLLTPGTGCLFGVRLRREFDRSPALHAQIFKPARLAWYYFSTERVRGLDSGRFRYLLFVILE